MRKLSFFAAIAALAALATAALAADVPTKTQPFGPYPTNGCGWYYGINAIGSAAPIQNAPVGATEIGGSIGGTLGYTCATNGGKNFWFAEVIGDVQSLNGSANGFALSGPAHIEQRIGFGGPVAQFLAFLPNFNGPAVSSLPLLPNGITAGTPNGYIYAALNEDDISAQFMLSTGRAWAIAPEFGAGILARLSNNVVVDAWAGVKLTGGEFCIGGVSGASCPKLGTGAVTGVSFKY